MSSSMINSSTCTNNLDLMNRLSGLNNLPDSAYSDPEASERLKKFLDNNKGFAITVHYDSRMGEAFKKLASRISNIPNGDLLAQHATWLAVEVSNTSPKLKMPAPNPLKQKSIT